MTMLLDHVRHRGLRQLHQHQRASICIRPVGSDLATRGFNNQAGRFACFCKPVLKSSSGPEETPNPSVVNSTQTTLVQSLLRHKHLPLVLTAIFLSGLACCGMAVAAPSSSHQVALLDWLGERMLYYLGKVASLNVTAKVILVLSSTVPAVVLFGSIYSAMTKTELQPSFVKMYALLNRLPGAQVLNEKTVPAAILVNAVFFIGLFVFAVMLGVVTDEIKTTFKDIRNGKYPINQAGHTVILNWNSQTIPLLRQIAAGKATGQHKLYDRPVAVLSNKPKAEMDALIASRLKGINLEVYTRSGSPSVPADLAAVAAAKAASIIVLDPHESYTSNAEVSMLGIAPAQAAVALAVASPGLPNQNVVFQAPSFKGRASDHLVAFKRLTQLGSRVQIMKYSDEDLVTRVLAVSAIQPGMQQVMMKLLSPGNGSIRIQAVPRELYGATYQQARRSFADGVLCGVLMPDDTVDFLVPEHHILMPNERLVMLSHDPVVPVNNVAKMVFEESAKSADMRKASRGAYSSAPRRIVVVSMDPGGVTGLVDVFAELAPKGSTVTFLLPSIPSDKQCVARKGSCSFKYLSSAVIAEDMGLTPDDAGISSIPLSSILKAAGLKTATSVVVTGLSGMHQDDADAFVTATILQVQDAAHQLGRGDVPHVVARICKASTQKAINDYLDVIRKKNGNALLSSSLGDNYPPVSSGQIIIRPDLFQAEEMTATTLAQTAALPEYAHLISELVSAMGGELYLRNPLAYNLQIGDLHIFADVAETARKWNETAVGVIMADGHIVLGPEPTYPLNFQAGDRVIVLAEEFDMAKAKKS